MLSREELVQRKLARVEEMHRCLKNRTALLVIDMQRAFVDEGAALVDCCRQTDVPVIFTQYVYAETVPCLRGDPFGVEHLPSTAGDPTGFGHPSGNALLGQDGPNSPDIVDALSPRPDELLVQGYAYDKFYGTNLDMALRSRDIRYLIVTGVLADICVNATILSASTREYRVTAVTDGVATLWPHLLEACCEIWRRKFARLLSTEAIMEELRLL